MGTVICPYCFLEQARDELHYQCGGSCPHERGETRLFPPDQLNPEELCPHGRSPQARRHCSGCGHGLPREYVDGDQHLVALIGPPACGKSTFVGVLVHELREGEGRGLGGTTVELLGEDSRRQYRDLLGQPLYSHGRTPTPTMSTRRAVQSARHEPLMVALRPSSARRSTPWPWSRSGSTAVLVFYDTAGEDVGSEESVEFLRNYLTAARAVILMLDAGSLLAPEPARPDPREAISVLTDFLFEVDRREVPLAIVLSKIDVLTDAEDEFGPASPLRRPSRHIRSFDDTDGLDVHEEIRAWLSARGMGELDRTLASKVARYRYFGLSALGHSPLGGSQVAIAGIHPYRVEDPLLWLLTCLRALPRKPRPR